ncbi:unnamed protein product [Nesidiocoris tenuis]|uniref:Uncharacterized protein n=1 Tax=Nesidiocoris tenuis TaxID=355587 RepID=A0A6H5GBD3_9HEMI|nr:unnamed protein product [Nesidiocoris tenuis]
MYEVHEYGMNLKYIFTLKYIVKRTLIHASYSDKIIQNRFKIFIERTAFLVPRQ